MLLLWFLTGGVEGEPGGRVRTMTLISGSPLNIPVYQRAPGNSQLVAPAFDLTLP